MMIGQLVRERADAARLLPRQRIGVIMDIDPLRRGVPPVAFERPIGEIVILLTSGQTWHANPLNWEVISESG